MVAPLLKHAVQELNPNILTAVGQNVKRGAVPPMAEIDLLHRVPAVGHLVPVLLKLFAHF